MPAGEKREALFDTVATVDAADALVISLWTAAGKILAAATLPPTLRRMARSGICDDAGSVEASDAPKRVVAAVFSAYFLVQRVGQNRFMRAEPDP